MMLRPQLSAQTESSKRLELTTASLLQDLLGPGLRNDPGNRAILDLTGPFQRGGNRAPALRKGTRPPARLRFTSDGVRDERGGSAGLRLAARLAVRGGGSPAPDAGR